VDEKRHFPWIWDKGRGRLELVETTESGPTRITRFERVNERLVRVSVNDPRAINPVLNAVDCNNAAELADTEFERNPPGQLVVEP
jgi:hypothetical protein